LCGSSNFDSQWAGCALCGGSPAVRREQVHISGQTKTKLLAYADELKQFGVTVEISQPIQKSSDQIGFSTTDLFCLSLAVGDSLHHGILRSLILFLRSLAIPEVEIIRLRLDEPETISEILEAESQSTKLEPAEKTVAKRKPAKKPVPRKPAAKRKSAKPKLAKRTKSNRRKT
jgi:hypothetical protein